MAGLWTRETEWVVPGIRRRWRQAGSPGMVPAEREMGRGMDQETEWVAPGIRRRRRHGRFTDA